MRKILLITLLLFAPGAFACTLNWTPPTEGGTVEGYNLYINSDPALDVGNVSTWDCTGRQGDAYVKAYNVAGESLSSNTVNFMRIPGAPGTLTVQY